VIMSCKNGNDSGKKFREKLRSLQKKHDDSAHRKTDDHKDIPIIISDSSLDDSSVSTAVEKCLDDSGRVIKEHKSDSGHNFKVIVGCHGDSSASAPSSTRKNLVEALDDHKKDNALGCFDADSGSCQEENLPPVIVTADSLKDVGVAAAIAECVDPTKGGGVDTPVSLDPDDPSTGFGGRLNFRENKNLK
jgi:hypothetical protein